MRINLSTSSQILFLAMLCFFSVVEAEEQSAVTTGTIFCWNCDGDYSQCCDGFMGLPFCCSETLYYVQQGSDAVARFLDDNHLLTCTSNDDCPVLGNQIAGLVLEEAQDFDYCCNLLNICCSRGDYLKEQLQMLAATFGGPVGFAFFVIFMTLLIFGCCCCCCRKFCGGKNNQGQVVHTPPNNGRGHYQPQAPPYKI